MDDPCCDLTEVHYHCPECMAITSMYGHAVGDRTICDPAERRAWRQAKPEETP